jgi:hypothetical protein
MDRAVSPSRSVISSGYSTTKRLLRGFASHLLADLFASRSSYAPNTPLEIDPITPAADLSALRVRFA